MDFIERMRNRTREALSQAGADEDPAYVTDEYLEELLGSDLVEPDWASDPNLPEDLEAPPEASLTFRVYYCWNPVRFGGVYYFRWYMFTPPRGSCLNSWGRQRLSLLRWMGYRCPNSGAAIYQIGWWS